MIAAVLYLRILVNMFLLEAPDGVSTSGDGGGDADVASDEQAIDEDAELAELLGTPIARRTEPVRSPAISAVLAVALAAAATIALGVLPNLGGGVLSDTLALTTRARLTSKGASR